MFPDDSVDAVYMNALDHAFDLTSLVAEVRRVLRPGGVWIIDMVLGFEEGVTPGEFEATHWSTAENMIAQICEIGGLFCEGSLRELEQDHWKQAVLRAPEIN